MAKANQKKGGVLLSYLNTGLSAAMNILLVPFLISQLGAAEYGVYKIIYSFAGYLFILDFGIGTIVTRYVSLYMGKGEKERAIASFATSMAVCAVLVVLVVICGLALWTQIDVLYAATLTKGQLELANQLYGLMFANVIVCLVRHLFSGYINAFERFVFVNGMEVVRLAARFALVLILVYLTRNAVMVIAVDLLLSIVALAVDIAYSWLKLGMRIHLSKFDGSLIPGYLLLSGAIFFQAIVNQVNNSIDNVILGAMVSPEVVTTYSVGMTVYGLYVALPETVKNVFLPQATRLFGEKNPDDDGTKLTDFVVRAGRYEALMCIGIYCAFAFAGQDFIALWVGPENIGAWKAAMLLMAPVTIPMCQNLMISILNARNKRMVRSVILAIMAAFNIAATILLIPVMGYMGAALATFASLLIGHGFALNIYYKKVFNLRVWYMLRRTYGRILPCGIVAALACYAAFIPVSTVSWPIFVAKALVFLLLYGALAYKFALERSEIREIKSMIGLKK